MKLDSSDQSRYNKRFMGLKLVAFLCKISLNKFKNKKKVGRVGTRSRGAWGIGRQCSQPFKQVILKLLHEIQTNPYLFF